MHWVSMIKGLAKDLVYSVSGSKWLHRRRVSQHTPRLSGEKAQALKAQSTPPPHHTTDGGPIQICLDENNGVSGPHKEGEYDCGDVSTHDG